MSPNKDWFDIVKLCNRGTILMGNDTAYKIAGIWTMNIKMFDGVVRKLSDVRYVWDLRKNLIFFGTLESIGCTCIGKGCVLKVTWGALVAMKAIWIEKIYNIYQLDGNIVTNGVSNSTSIEEKTNNTWMWHTRLGHLSKRDLMELHKSGSLNGIWECKLYFCKFCVMEKQSMASFKKPVHISKEELHYIHFDVWGSTIETSQVGARYFIAFIDDFNR